MTKDEALQMCLEYIETDAHERKYVRHAIKQALAASLQPVPSLKEADVLMMAEAHGIDPSTKGLYGFYIDCISNQPEAPDLQAELDATNRQVEILSDALAESRREVAALVPKGWPSDDLVTEKAKQSGFDLSQMPNMLYSVRGNHAQLVNFAKAMIATSPAAQRQWVGLTQQDIDIAFDDTQEGGGFDDFARAIEAKLKEKNGWYRQHVTDGSPCWCEPEISYTNPETGASVIVHKEPQ